MASPCIEVGERAAPGARPEDGDRSVGCDGFHQLVHDVLAHDVGEASRQQQISNWDGVVFRLGDYHLSRARELHRADLRRWAGREVKAFKRDRGSLDRGFMIDLYRAVDAHRQAIRIAGGDQDRYAEILYPLAFWDTVHSNAQRYRIDPLLALSLMRQESMFDPEARSPANARGLMQLLPSTAAQVAADIGRDGKIDLYDPQTNIELGIAHLRELADRYAVAKWDARSGDRPADEWVEAISYSETRDYVKKVLTNRQKYARLYGMRQR